jgi:hypothetical protein
MMNVTYPVAEDDNSFADGPSHDPQYGTAGTGKSIVPNIPTVFSRPRFRGTSRQNPFCLLAALALMSLSQFANAQALPPPGANPTDRACVVTQAEFAPWFEGGTVTADGAGKPADSVNFPNVPNCSFYKWSEQMFLWLTSQAPGGGGRVFESAEFYNVSGLGADGKRTLLPNAPGKLDLALRNAQVGPRGRPVVFDRDGNMLSVIRPLTGPDGKMEVRTKSGALVEIERIELGPDGNPIFLDKSSRAIDVRVQRGRPIVLDESGKPIEIRSTRIARNGAPFFLDASGNAIGVGQANGSGVLMAQTGSLVYYASEVNDVYAYLLTGTKSGGITPAPTRFPTSQPELDKIAAFALSHGKTFPHPNVLALEVKSAWVETAGLDVNKYITMTATIPTYDKSDYRHWVLTGSTPARLALVGMHIVGSVAGNPEMIWATFEHVDNSPNAAYSYNDASGQTMTVVQNTSGSWLFSASNSSGRFNEQHMNARKASSIDAEPDQTIGPSDTRRENAWGSASNAFKNTEIIAINNSILGMLAPGDVRKNYLLIGATWTIGGVPPGDGNQVGTNQLANSTMETYQQPSNCFSCHHGPRNDGLNPKGLSHMYGQLKPLFQQKKATRRYGERHAPSGR